MENKIIKTELVNWRELKLFQPANLKKMSKVQLDKLKTSLRNNGFKSPFYVWESGKDLWCLDGHTRIPILKLLADEGDAVPDELPANFVYCKNMAEAKKAVLIYNSKYADIQQDSLAEWIKDLNFDDLMGEIDIVGIDNDLIFKNLDEIIEYGDEKVEPEYLIVSLKFKNVETKMKFIELLDYFSRHKAKNLNEKIDDFTEYIYEKKASGQLLREEGVLGEKRA